MDQNLNNSQFIPSQPPVAPVNHNKTKNAFVIIGIIIVLGLIWWLIPSKSNDGVKTLTPEQKTALLQELSKTVVPVTDKQKESLLKDLSKETVTLTPEQKEALLKELSK